MVDKRITTVREVAANLRVGFRSVYWLVQQADLPARKVLGRLRFHFKDVDACVRGAALTTPVRRTAAESSESVRLVRAETDGADEDLE